MMISPNQILFLVLASLALGGAVRVVGSHRIFHAALWLIGSFFGVAALYMLLESPFMAGIQLFLYIGGVAVLTVIAIMVTKGVMRQDKRMLNDPWSSAIVAGALFMVMVWMILRLPLPEAPDTPVPAGGVTLLGAALVDPSGYFLPFQVVGVMLLIVLIGALYLGKER